MVCCLQVREWKVFDSRPYELLDKVLITAQVLVASSIVYLGMFDAVSSIQLRAFEIWHRFFIICTYDATLRHYYNGHQMLIIKRTLVNLSL